MSAKVIQLYCVNKLTHWAKHTTWLSLELDIVIEKYLLTFFCLCKYSRRHAGHMCSKRGLNLHHSKGSLCTSHTPFLHALVWGGFLAFHSVSDIGCTSGAEKGHLKCFRYTFRKLFWTALTNLIFLCDEEIYKKLRHFCFSWYCRSIAKNE